MKLLICFFTTTFQIQLVLMKITIYQIHSLFQLYTPETINGLTTQQDSVFSKNDSDFSDSDRCDMVHRQWKLSLSLGEDSLTLCPLIWNIMIVSDVKQSWCYLPIQLITQISVSYIFSWHVDGTMHASFQNMLVSYHVIYCGMTIDILELFTLEGARVYSISFIYLVWRVSFSMHNISHIIFTAELISCM